MMMLCYGPKEKDTGLSPVIFLCTDYDGELRSNDGEMISPVFLSVDDIINHDETLFQPFADSIELLCSTLLNEQEDKDDGKVIDIADVRDKVNLRNFILQFADIKREDASGQRNKGKWVTVNGTHLLLDSVGNIVKGPAHLVGSHISEISNNEEHSSSHTGASGASNSVEMPEKPIVDVMSEIGRLGLDITRCKTAKQDEHIPGTARYRRGKSYFTIGMGEIENIVNANVGKGYPLPDRNGNWRQIENIDCGRIIGYNVDNSGNAEPTRFADLHHSRDGWHLVPTYDRRPK